MKNDFYRQADEARRGGETVRADYLKRLGDALRDEARDREIMKRSA